MKVAPLGSNPQPRSSGDFSGGTGKQRVAIRVMTPPGLRRPSTACGAERSIVDAVVIVPPNVWSQMDDFESDATGAVPLGFAEVGENGRVVTTRAFAGAKSLRVNDTSASVLTNVLKWIACGS